MTRASSWHENSVKREAFLKLNFKGQEVMKKRADEAKKILLFKKKKCKYW